MTDNTKVQVPVDATRKMETTIPVLKKGAQDTKVLRIDLRKFQILNPTSHTFINTLLQLSNQILGLKQQYQQHIAAIDDISLTIKELKGGKIRDIYKTKGGMFMVKERAGKDLISNLQKRRQQIINANNITVGQIEKNHTLYLEYCQKIAVMMAPHLEDKSKAQKILDAEKEMNREINDLLTMKD